MRRFLLAFSLLLGSTLAASAAILTPILSGHAGTVPLCSVAGVTCQYAYSLDRKVVAGATYAYTLYNGSTTHNVGFLSSGAVNVADGDSFCASVRDCFIYLLHDQTGNGCDLTIPPTTSAADLPLYMKWPAHAGLPVYMTAYHTSFAILAQALSATSAGCTALNGNLAKSIIVVTNSRFGTTVGGRGGLSENPAGITPQAAFSWASAYVNSGQLTYGVDTEGANLGKITNGVVTDQIGVITYDGNNPGTLCLYYNGSGLIQSDDTNTNSGSNCQLPDYFFLTPSNTLATQDWVGIGTSPDQSQAGSEIMFEMVLTSNGLSSGAAAAAYTNTNAFYGGLALDYQGPADVLPVPQGADVPETIGMQNGWGVRAMSDSYIGPLLNVCQGTSGTCEDIGQVNHLIDVATVSAYCGPISGLNNCTVQTAYNQGILATFATHGGTSNQDMVASSGATRPTLTFSCNNGLPCMTFNGSSQKLCMAGNINSNFGTYVITAVVERTGNFTSGSQQTFMGSNTQWFGAYSGTNNISFQPTATGAGFVFANPVSDSVMHSVGISSVDSTSADMYIDGTHYPGSGAISGSFTVAAPWCLGAYGGSTDFLTGNIMEASIFNTPSSPGFTATSSDFDNLRANEKLYYTLP